MNLKQIDLMSRESLVNLGVKLQVSGHKNMFSKPYIKKSHLKPLILKEISNMRKMRRANSTSCINSNNSNNNNSNSNNNNNNNNNSNNNNSNNNNNNNGSDNGDNVSNDKIRRSKSFTSFNKKSLKRHYSNLNDIIQNYDIDRCMFPKVSKLVAIGDIHGDLSVAIKALKLAGVIDNSIPDNSRNINNIHWTGGDAYVVQLGDQIDRVRPTKLYNNLCAENDSDLVKDEGSDLKIISLFENLHKEAKKKVVLYLVFLEIMN